MNPITLNHVDVGSGISPLKSAIFNGYSVAMIIFIVSVHGKYTDMVYVGTTPLHFLISSVERELGSGKRINSKYQQQRILEILSFLLDYKPSLLFAQDEMRRSPLQMAFSLKMNCGLRNHIAAIMISHIRKYASLCTQALLETTLDIANNNNLPKKLIAELAHLKTAGKKY